MKIGESMKFSYLIPKFRYRSEFPLKVHWFSSSGLNPSTIVGVLGAFGIILLAQDKKVRGLIGTLLSCDGEISSTRFWFVPGLENLGNNCFLNVILQALSSCTSFQKYLAEIVTCEGLSVEAEEELPLVSSLSSLVEELRSVRHRRTVISPRRMMLAMDHYKQNFNLTTQQDAEEALSHLLSLLRKELSEHYVIGKCYLSDLRGLPCGRIITKSNEEESEWLRWKRIFLGPFDGILGSILVCQSCSFQISLDFQQFQSLHLSLAISCDDTIVDECTLEDCLNNFFVAERLENYCCRNCWHNAAIHYLSIASDNKVETEILQCCNRNDSCDCETLTSLDGFMWSNRSRVYKQLSLARSPKILSIHMQRASYDMFGQSVKLLDHLSFPLILDLSSFIYCGGVKKLEKISGFGPENEKYKFPFPHFLYQNVPLNLGMQSKVHVAESHSMAKTFGENGENGKNGNCSYTSEDVPNSLNAGRCADAHTDLSSKSSEAGTSSFSLKKIGDGNVGVNLPSAPSKAQKYRLVAAVEHLGSNGRGHYMVYRRVTAMIDDEEQVALLESAIEQWYRISDSEVLAVSEKDVLGANPSILFYEKS